ncbi:hypothetical protein FXO37_00116 [Capsicum annuum]|nr:hypothetical protein FXO37_00116 [Capsicum annuum]
MSTVVSESAFSQGQQHLGDNRHSMGSNGMNVLVCLRDWIRVERRNQGMEPEPSNELKLEEIMSSRENSAESSPMHDFAPVDFDYPMQGENLLLNKLINDYIVDIIVLWYEKSVFYRDPKSFLQERGIQSAMDEIVMFEEVLPEGFMNRVKDRGLIVSKWVPHARIMRHTSIGGFMNHCGWNSTIKCMHFGVPLIAMPLNIDQFLTAKYVVELGIALEVGRDENVRLERKEIAKSIRNVIVEKKGEDLRAKSGELSEKIRIKEKKDIEEEAVEELRKLCLMNKKEKIVE